MKIYLYSFSNYACGRFIKVGPKPMRTPVFYLPGFDNFDKSSQGGCSGFGSTFSQKVGENIFKRICFIIASVIRCFVK